MRLLWGSKKPKGEEYTIGDITFSLKEITDAQDKRSFWARIDANHTPEHDEKIKFIYELLKNEMRNKAILFNIIPFIESKKHSKISSLKFHVIDLDVPSYYPGFSNANINDVRTALQSLQKKYPTAQELIPAMNKHKEKTYQPFGVPPAYKEEYTEGWHFITNKDYIKGNNKKNVPQDEDPYQGWKIHVSATTREAQRMLAELAMDTGILQMKFAPDIESLQDPKNKQQGKTAVFYCSEEDAEGNKIDWKKFIEKAEAIVKTNGGPGQPVRCDRPVPGTSAVFYRNDRDNKGKYVARYEVSHFVERDYIDPDAAYNAHNQPDPFKEIVIGDIPYSSLETDLIEVVKTGNVDQLQKLLDEGACILAKDPASGKDLQQIADERLEIESLVNNGKRFHIIAQEVSDCVKKYMEASQARDEPRMLELIRRAIDKQQIQLIVEEKKLVVNVDNAQQFKAWQDILSKKEIVHHTERNNNHDCIVFNVNEALEKPGMRFFIYLMLTSDLDTPTRGHHI